MSWGGQASLPRWELELVEGLEAFNIVIVIVIVIVIFILLLLLQQQKTYVWLWKSSEFLPLSNMQWRFYSPIFMAWWQLWFWLHVKWSYQRGAMGEPLFDEQIFLGNSLYGISIFFSREFDYISLPVSAKKFLWASRLVLPQIFVRRELHVLYDVQCSYVVGHISW